MTDRPVSFGWSLWCARAGQLFEWGISPQGDNGISGLDEQWYRHGAEANVDLLEEDAHPSNVAFIDGGLLVQSLPALTFPVWVGVTIFWLRKMGLKKGKVTDGKRTVSVILSEKAEPIYCESEGSPSRSVKMFPGFKCAKCPYEFFCRFTREVAYDEHDR